MKKVHQLGTTQTRSTLASKRPFRFERQILDNNHVAFAFTIHLLILQAWLYKLAVAEIDMITGQCSCLHKESLERSTLANARVIFDSGWRHGLVMPKFAAAAAAATAGTAAKLVSRQQTHLYVARLLCC